MIDREREQAIWDRYANMLCAAKSSPALASIVQGIPIERMLHDPVYQKQMDGWESRLRSKWGESEP